MLINKKLSVISYQLSIIKGQSLVEILLAIALASLILPGIAIGIFASRSGVVAQKERFYGSTLMEEAREAVRSVREKGWTTFALNGIYHPVITGSNWTLVDGPQNLNGFTRQIVISDVYRQNGAIVQSGGSLDPSTKKVDITVSWLIPIPLTMSSTLYLTRYLDNLSFIQTTLAEFMTDTRVNVDVTNTAGGEVTLAVNTKAKWCEPSFSSATIDLPDGPPVAVDAKSQSNTSIPNDAFVATSPHATSSVKLAYVNVTANTDPPTSSLRGTFTLDESKYSNPSYIPSGINLDNNFKTNDVKQYTSASGKTYALMAIDRPDKEVIAILVNDGNPANDNDTSGEYSDPVNKIYKYYTFFNTRIFNTSAGLDTGFSNPGANVDENTGDDNGFESNPTRAYTDNNSFAVDTNSGDGTGTNCAGSDKDRHRYYNYGFSINSGANISGVEVRLDARVDSQSGSPFMCVQLSWDGGTSWTTAQTTGMLNTTEATYILGSPTDTWGRTWSGNNFTNSNFRVRVTNVASSTSRDFSLDWVSVRVHYSISPSATNDQAPFGYGGSTLTVLQDTGYVASGGYLYAFDLSNIDSKSTGSELDQVGCRIQLDGYDCRPGSPASDVKYNAGETGTSWSDIGSPAHNDCSDGGNIELNASNDLYGVRVGSNNYIFIAVGAGTNPEFNIVDATNIPDTGTSPSIHSSNCGRISGGNSNWKRVSSYDFNSDSGTEEASNSVFAKSDGTRAYISSNGTSDSKQFYILNTSNKNSPGFLSGSSSSGPSSGYYQGTGSDGEMYPRRSLTVLNGQRVVLVGKDGINNGNNAQEYQVLNLGNEVTPGYCGGIDFNDGFNDLTSVSEADGDNYVYMVANNTLNELKVVQGGPDGTYLDTGTLESVTLDAGYSTAFNAYSATLTKPSNTDLKFQFAGADAVSGSCESAVFDFTGPDGTSDTYYTATQSAIFIGTGVSGYKNPARCFRYKAYFSTTNFDNTPLINDMTINYSP